LHALRLLNVRTLQNPTFNLYQLEVKLIGSSPLRVTLCSHDLSFTFPPQPSIDVAFEILMHISLTVAAASIQMFEPQWQGLMPGVTPRRDICVARMDVPQQPVFPGQCVLRCVQDIFGRSLVQLADLWCFTLGVVLHHSVTQRHNAQVNFIIASRNDT
jgi:hypothetical protein